MPILTADELNKIAKQSGYTGGTFSSVGLPTTSSSTPTTTTQQPPLVNPNKDYYTQPITSNDLVPTNTINYQQPQQVSSGAFPTINETTYNPIPQETEISNLIRDLAKSNTLESDKLAFTAQQEQAFGLPDLQKAELDYTSQLKQLEADYKNINDKMQLASEGRGITKAGLAPITASEQRKILLQANTVSALQSAAQGRVAFAQQQVDRAVNLQFAQKEADRKAKIANLELLMQNPTLTLAQQKRADARKIALQKEAEADDKKKEDAKTIMNWGLELANNPVVANQIMAIANSNNPDLSKAFALYSAYVPKQQGQVLGSASTGYFTYDPITGKSTPISSQQAIGGTTPAPIGGSTTTVPTTYKFSPTQLNAGSNKAGLSLNDFQSLNSDVQNYFVNTTASKISAINSLFNELNNGTKTANEIRDLINSSNTTQAVKDYWLSKIPQTATEQGFLDKISSTVSDAWGVIKNILGF